MAFVNPSSRNVYKKFKSPHYTTEHENAVSAKKRENFFKYFLSLTDKPREAPKVAIKIKKNCPSLVGHENSKSLGF
jgi:hypothetical protein